MDINLSQYAGFCDGVKRAYDMVMDIDMASVKKPVFVLGSLVHNEDVIKKIAEKGIDRISREDFFSAGPEKIGTIIINAHGAGPDIFAHARKIGTEIVDTTCPRVIKVQKLAQIYAKRGYRIIIVGDRDHKEVKGIDEWGDGNAFIISSEEDVEKISFGENENIAVLSQTTQNEDFYKKTAEAIKKRYSNANVSFTTCHTTHARQGEIKDLARDNDVVIVIGSGQSANSKRLWEISSAINPKSYFIERASEIEKEWFAGCEKAGVTAGASTPSWIIEEVMESLQKI